jgi:Pectate lyase superfamily protein
MISQSSRTGTRLRPGPISVRRNRAFRPADALGLDELESRVVPSVMLSVTAAPYGADPTGVADSTAAINRCIADVHNDGGGTVYIPAGTYKITHQGEPTIALWGNVTLQGAGENASTIRLANNQGDFEELIGLASSSSNTNIAMYDLTIDFNDQNGNMPTSAPNNSTNDRIGIGIFSGGYLTFQRIRLTNYCGIWALVPYGPSVHDVTIDHVTIDNVGGSSFDFDNSIIETRGTNFTVTNNTVSSRYGAGTVAARSAIETHCSNLNVSNNTLIGFWQGISAGDFGDAVLNNNTYRNNTMTGCYSGIALWSSAPPNGNGLTNWTIDGNNITLDVNNWYNSNIVRGEGHQGISLIDDITYQSGQIDHLYITNNTITYTNYSGSRSGSGDNRSNGIDFVALASPPTYTNVYIQNNYINHSLANGIDFNFPVNGLTVTGNVITDPGSSPASLSAASRSAIYLGRAVQNATVQPN